jgi:hypothetical protein
MRVLVVAKAPVAGEVKTRLGARIGEQEAARTAAAALVDTRRAAATAVGGGRCHLALSRDQSRAVEGERIRSLLRDWTITPQRGADFAERLVNAHEDAGPGDVVQIGMDTPQVTPELLADAARPLAEYSAVLGAADDGGASWREVSGDLPSDFGFAIDVHAHEPDTVYVVPITSDELHYPPDGRLRVYRTRTGGDEWEPLTDGLPQDNCYVNVLRDAMAVDAMDPCGVYVGTTGGQVYVSPDGGDHWSPVVRDLPAVLSVEVQTLP